MSKDFKKHLATEILSEKQTVSYRTLARAQKVHVNAAKCMLYEFYEEQTKRKPGSVYATYLLSGIKRQDKALINGKPNGVKHDQDEEMPPSSPPPFTSSMMDASQHGSESAVSEREHVPRKTITLAREEALDEIKSSYESISSIHLYSLSPGKIPDLITLTDIGRSLYADVFVKEDPLTHNKTYGVIQNPQVRRRKRKRPVIPPAAAAAAAPQRQPVKDEKPTAQASAKPAHPTLRKEETASRPSSRDSTSTRDSKLPTLKRGGSDIFKAFAKGKDKKPSSQLKQEEDVKMTDEAGPDAEDEEEEEDDAMFLDTGTTKTKKRGSDAKKERDDKAAKLRKMMDSDDEEAEEAQVPKVEDATDSEIRKEPPMPAPEAKKDEEDEVAWSASDDDGKKTKKTTEKEEEAGPKRRRGKRKVMKKKTMKDEDGFLVTREEEVWESFSESDREEKKKAGGSSAVTAKSQGSQKSAAKGSTQGKKDIMSFFGKKK